MLKQAFTFLLVCLLVFGISATVQARINDSESRLAIQSIIVKWANFYGVDPGLAIYLAAIESDLNNLAANPTSSARGLYQFLEKSTWPNYCEGDIYSAEDNTRCAMMLIADGQISHWTADIRTKLKLIQAGFINND